jgi:Ran GTPase-activating protein (RanGAP) involved in mRNA processing and transport
MSSPADAYLHDEIRLDLTSKEIDCTKAKQIAHELATNTVLTFLNLDKNNIGDNGASAIANALSTNRTLTTIGLCENSIGDAGAVAIALALLQNKSLKNLCLTGNFIGRPGAVAFADTLRTNTCLRVLSLGENSIGDHGAVALAGALAANQSLVVLGLNCCSIGTVGATALARPLRCNVTLTTLYIGENMFDAAGLTSIVAALTENKGLSKLHLDVGSINNDGAEIVAEMLRKNTSLEFLTLRSNKIGDAGATAILSALTECNNTLTSLNLTENTNISSSVLSDIEEIIKANKEGTPSTVHPIVGPAPTTLTQPPASLPPQATEKETPATEMSHSTDNRSVTHPIVYPAPNANRRTNSAQPHALVQLETEPEIEATPQVELPQTATTVIFHGTQDPGEDEDNETDRMEGLPKHRAELEYAIRLHEPIRDATEQKISLMQRAIATGKYPTGDELEQRVTDLTEEIQHTAQLEAFVATASLQRLLLLQSDLTRERDAEVRMREAMRKRFHSETMVAAHREPTPAPGASVTSVANHRGTQDPASGEDNNMEWMDSLSNHPSELGFAIRRVTMVHDAAEKILRRFQTAAATGNYPTGEELERLLLEITLLERG